MKKLCFKIMLIPKQTYVKFISNSCPMHAVCIDIWENIWKMKDSDFWGKRFYIPDFAIYDELIQNPGQTLLDIYIGVQK